MMLEAPFLSSSSSETKSNVILTVFFMVYLMKFSSICLEGLMEIMKTFIQDSQSTAKHFDLKPPRYKGLQHWVNNVNICIVSDVFLRSA
jgi:hypothetical protein